MTCDALGNQVTAPEDDLVTMITPPDGQYIPLPDLQQRSHLCDFKYVAKLLGKYVAEVSLRGAPLKGSPLAFDVRAGSPDVKMSRLTPPGPPPLFAGIDYELIVDSVDRFGNECGVGGHHVTAQLGSVGLSRQSLPPGQDEHLEVEDRGNGTYVFKLNIKSPCELKVIVSVVDGKEASDFAPVTLSFTTEQWVVAKQERDARRSIDSSSATVELSAAMNAVAFANKLKRRASSKQVTTEPALSSSADVISDAYEA